MKNMSVIDVGSKKKERRREQELNKRKKDAITAAIELKYDDRVIPCIKECRSETQIANLMMSCRTGRIVEYYERIIAYKKANPDKGYKAKVFFNDKNKEVTIKIAPEQIDTNYRYSIELNNDENRIYIIRHMVEDGLKFRTERNRFRFKRNDDYKKFVGEYPTIYSANGNQRRYIDLLTKLDLKEEDEI